MITLYGFDTSNTIKIALLLEELEASYVIHPVNIRKGANRSPEFLAVNPLGKVPVIVDRTSKTTPITVTESAAILIYLAEKHGTFLAEDTVIRAKTMEWLLFQAASCGPIFGQSEYWLHLAPQKNPPAIARYAELSSHIMDQLDGHLAINRYFAGENYTIADMAHFGWMSRRHKAGLHIGERSDLRRWFDAVDGRPAARRALDALNRLAKQ